MNKKGGVPPVFFGEDHHAWQGDNASYGAAHQWLAKYHSDRKKKCEFCSSKKKLQFAKLHGQNYTRDIDDYIILCFPCHNKYDNNFTAINAEKTHCTRGHLLAGDNLYQKSLPRRDCRKCALTRAEKFLKANPENIASAKKRWKERNREKVLSDGREYERRKRLAYSLVNEVIELVCGRN